MTAKARITELRTKAGLTQMQLATAMGVDPSTVRNLEKGRAGIEQIERVIKLCKALGCNVEDLIEYEPES
jgi:transcriptional regulator with XRE-family HTH domain